jgi:hypothetical protein
VAHLSPLVDQLSDSERDALTNAVRVLARLTELATP